MRWPSSLATWRLISSSSLSDYERKRHTCGSEIRPAAGSSFAGAEHPPQPEPQPPSARHAFRADRATYNADAATATATATSCPSIARPHASMIIRPTWNATNAATYASVVMYTNVNAGQRHDRVSRRITASVDTHWQHSAKNTISDTADATA